MDDVLDLHDGVEELYNAEDLDEKEALGEEALGGDENGDSKTVKKEVVSSEFAEGDDLYDAAIEPSGVINSEKRSESTDTTVAPTSTTTTHTSSGGNAYSSTSLTTSISTSRKYHCYVGNMHWWATDADLERAIQSTGVSDIADIKFYENRANGQSKGFGLLVFNSEQSVKLVMEKLPQMKLYDQSLIVLPYNKQSLAKLEEATKKTDTRERKDEKSGMINMGTVRIGPTGAIGSLTSLANIPRQQPQPTSLMNLNFGTPQINPLQTSIQANRAPLVTSLPLQALLPRAPTVNLGAPPPGGEINLNRPPPGFPSMGPATVNTSQPPPNTMLRPSLATMGGIAHLLGVQQQPMSIQPGLPAGAHINPQVYPTFAQTYGHSAENGAGGGAPISEMEFEEVMNRNRTVSSSAIGRAVSDAAAGDFSSAIETLVTAISLIRQSRIAHDDRCKVLIASLQDTLQGIESKSYNTRRHRSSGRDRSRSPDRSGRKRHRRSSRSRSRSRDARERYDYSPMRGGRRY